MSVLAQWVADQPALASGDKLALLAVGDQNARNRPNGLGILCCLGAVLVVLAIIIIARNRRNRGDRGAVD